MDMKKALKYGIHAEKEAQEFYRIWSENVKEEYLKKELLELAEWEKGHEDELKDYYECAYDEKFIMDPDIVVDPELKIQTKDFNDVTSLLRIASAAYLSEMRAAEFYKKLSETCGQGDAKVMFEKLQQMEEGHMAQAKKRYMKMREDLVGFHAF